MKYTISTIQRGIETIHIETDDYKAAQKVYLHLKACNKGRVRLNGGEILPIFKADDIMLRKTEGGKRWITSRSIIATW